MSVPSPGWSYRMITNSSPPVRTTVSTLRRHRAMRSAMTFSNSSPPLRPRLSLIRLKPSRLMNNTVISRP